VCYFPRGIVFLLECEPHEADNRWHTYVQSVAYLFCRLLLDEQFDLKGLPGLEECPPLLFVRQKVGGESDKIGSNQQQAVHHNLKQSDQTV